MAKTPLKRGRMRAEQTKPDPPPLPETDETAPDIGLPAAGPEPALAAGPPNPVPAMGMGPDQSMGIDSGARLAPLGGGPPMGGLGPMPGGMPGAMPGGAPPMDFLAALGGAPGGPPLGRMPRDAEAASSPLLDLLAGNLAPSGGMGGDPYATGPMPTDLNTGTQDPQMGMQGLLSLLALGMAGAGGQPPPGTRGGYQAGRSGVPEGPYGIGTAPRYGDSNPFTRY